MRQGAKPDNVARWLNLTPDASALIGWDVFDAILTPGDIILLVSWRDSAAAEAFEGAVTLRDSARLRRVGIVRDYGMFDRREAPQYYPCGQGRRDDLRVTRRARECAGGGAAGPRSTVAGPLRAWRTANDYHASPQCITIPAHPVAAGRVAAPL